VLIHGLFGLVILLMPAEATRQKYLPPIEILKREQKPKKPPPKKDKEPPKPLEVKPMPKRVAMVRKLPPEPPPEPEPQEPPQEPVVPPSFGISLEGTATAAPGSGVQVPRGETLLAKPPDPKDPKKKPKKAAPRRSGFKTSYGKGEHAPLAVVTTMPKIQGQKVQAEYPEKARELGIEGRVVLELTIDAQGKVKLARVLKGLHPLLDASAKAAALKMRFVPGTVNGTPVTVKIRYKFTFVLD
jgi:protein TonB